MKRCLLRIFNVFGAKTYLTFFKIKAKVHLTAAYVKLLRLDKNLRGFRIL